MSLTPVSVRDYGAVGSILGTVYAGSSSVACPNTTGYAMGDTIIIPGAGAAGTDLTVTISSLTSTTITISTNASTTVQNAVISTTGSITNGTSALTVGSAGRFVVGCWVGVQGAGASAAPLVAKVTQIVGSVLTLSINASTTVSNARTAIDDKPSIQAALDAVEATGGGSVWVPAGTYIIGTPLYASSYPVLLGTNVYLRGEGIANTTLRTCDQARMVNLSAPTYYAAAVLATKHAPHYDAGASLTNTVHDAAVSDLTLDGNMFNQPSYLVGGNRTQGTLPDCINLQILSDVTGGSLTVGHTYQVGVTYLDSLGRETANYSSVPSIPIGAGHGSIQVRLPNPPPFAPSLTGTINSGSNSLTLSSASGLSVNDTLYVVGAGAASAAPQYGLFQPLVAQITAIAGSVVTLSGTAGTSVTSAKVSVGAQQMAVYVRDTADPLDAYGNATGYERKTPQQAIGGNNTITITTHTAGTALLPGSGLFGNSEGTVSYGVLLDNARNVHLFNLGIKDVVLDGICISTNLGFLSSQIKIEDVWIDNTWRCPVSFTGKSSEISFTNVLATNAVTGVDFEPGFAGLPITNVAFNNCQFYGKGQPGSIGMAANPHSGNTDLTNLRFNDCVFDGFNINVHVGAPGGYVSARFIGGRLSNSMNIGASVTSGSVDFIGVHFYGNSRPFNATDARFYIPSGSESYDVDIQQDSGNAISVTLDDCTVTATLANTFCGFYCETGATGHRIINNRFEQLTGSSTMPYISLYSDQAKYVVHSNSGVFKIQDNIGSGTKQRNASTATSPAQIVSPDSRQFAITIGVAAVSYAYTFSSALAANAQYVVKPQFHWNSGGWWLSAQSNTGFTINWVTSPGGAGSTLDFTVEY